MSPSVCTPAHLAHRSQVLRGEPLREGPCQRSLCHPRLLASPSISTVFPLGRVSCSLSHTPHFLREHALPSPPWEEGQERGLKEDVTSVEN